MASSLGLDKVALTIAGSDSGGGAGIQADLKTFEAHRLFGTSVITAITAQNTVGVRKAIGVSEDMVQAQLDAVTEDFDVAAAKTGMLFNAGIIRVVARAFDRLAFPLVVDPVMVASSGDPLLEPNAMQALREELLPRAKVITPNLMEAGVLAGMEMHEAKDMLRAAERIAKDYPQAWVLVKGGHLKGERPNDLLHHQGQNTWIEGEWVHSQDTHGTGCTLSAAITARLALGATVPEAVRAAKRFLTEALRHAWTGLGKGRGSLKHHSVSL